MFELGSTVEVEIGGEILSATLDDRILPDRTCGQYDSGFWAILDNDDGVFISVYDGRVWNDDALPWIIGVCPALYRAAVLSDISERAMEARAEIADDYWNFRELLTGIRNAATDCGFQLSASLAMMGESDA